MDAAEKVCCQKKPKIDGLKIEAKLFVTQQEQINDSVQFCNKVY